MFFLGRVRVRRFSSGLHVLRVGSDSDIDCCDGIDRGVGSNHSSPGRVGSKKQVTSWRSVLLSRIDQIRIVRRSRIDQGRIYQGRIDQGRHQIMVVIETGVGSIRVLIDRVGSIGSDRSGIGSIRIGSYQGYGSIKKVTERTWLPSQTVGSHIITRC